MDCADVNIRGYSRDPQKIQGTYAVKTDQARQVILEKCVLRQECRCNRQHSCRLTDDESDIRKEVRVQYAPNGEPVAKRDGGRKPQEERPIEHRNTEHKQDVHRLNDSCDRKTVLEKVSCKHEPRQEHHHDAGHPEQSVASAAKECKEQEEPIDPQAKAEDREN